MKKDKASTTTGTIVSHRKSLNKTKSDGIVLPSNKKRSKSTHSKLHRNDSSALASQHLTRQSSTKKAPLSKGRCSLGAPSPVPLSKNGHETSTHKLSKSKTITHLQKGKNPWGTLSGVPQSVAPSK